MTDGRRIAGIVLAGGEGRRLGGGKALTPLLGKPLIAHGIDRLRPQVASLWLSVRRDQAELTTLGLPIIADGGDEAEASGGVAQAIAGSLATVLDAGSDVAITVPCDTPFLPPDLVARLIETLERSRAPAAIVASGGRLHPTIGAWTRAALEPLGASLAAGERKMQTICSAIAAVVDAEACAWPAARFFNVNTTAELEEAASMAERDSSAAARGGEW